MQAVADGVGVEGDPGDAGREAVREILAAVQGHHRVGGPVRDERHQIGCCGGRELVPLHDQHRIGRQRDQTRDGLR